MPYVLLGRLRSVRRSSWVEELERRQQRICETLNSARRAWFLRLVGGACRWWPLFCILWGSWGSSKASWSSSKASRNFGCTLDVSYWQQLEQLRQLRRVGQRTRDGEKSCDGFSSCDGINWIIATIDYLVGGLEHFLFFHILGTCSNPNWFSYFSEGLVNHQPATSVSKNLRCRCREGFLHPAPQDAPVAAPENRMWGALGGIGNSWYHHGKVDLPMSLKSPNWVKNTIDPTLSGLMIDWRFSKMCCIQK